MVAVSSCIAGTRCRYDGQDSFRLSIMDEIGDSYIAVCPEVLAGLGIPRQPCEIVGGSVVDVLAGHARIFDRSGADITERMLLGAERALQICLENGVTKAYLKSKSPTCGCGAIYDGTFSSTLKPGSGVFTALLLRNGINVIEVR